MYNFYHIFKLPKNLISHKKAGQTLLKRIFHKENALERCKQLRNNLPENMNISIIGRTNLRAMIAGGITWCRLIMFNQQL